MMTSEQVKKVLIPQNILFRRKDETVVREALSAIRKLKDTPHILIITGVRRAGKSTLLKQINENFYFSEYSYLNFEDERLLSFTAEDFPSVHESFLELGGKSEIMFFDEIQNVNEWETAVRRFHNEKIKVIITGSNASLMSRDLGTKLTGRHLDIVIYPFSFKEYLEFKTIRISDSDIYIPEITAVLRKEFRTYFEKGGIPEFIRYQRDEIIQQIYEDILIKDIIVRYGLADEKSFRELARLLISNIGKPYSLNKLKNILGFGRVNTVKNYISFMENSYLLFQVEKFDPSVKKQIINNKKIYCIDNAFINLVSFETTENLGRKLENLVFIELKRRQYSIHYHRGKYECDFIAVKKNKVEQVIQVCYEINIENRDREINGAIEAACMHKLKAALVLTMDHEEETEINEIKLKLLPVWKWLLT